MSQTTKFSWIVSIPTDEPDEPFDSLYCQVEDVVQELLAKSGKQYRLRRYPFSPLEGSSGSLMHMLDLTDNMVKLACDFYMEIYLHKPVLDSIHIIAPQNGAAFAMKFVAFFAHWQYDIPRLSESVDNFDGTWNLFPLSNVTCGNHLAWSPLIRSLTVVQPSLPSPKPGFFARHLALPDVYFFTKANCTPLVNVSCLFRFDGLGTTDQLEEFNIEGPGTKTVILPPDEWKDAKKVKETIKRELSSLWDEYPPEEVSEM